MISQYDEAFEFCSGKGPEHDICPYSVICPDGPLKLPYGGSQAEKTSWAPIYHPFNSWVLVTEPQVCVKYQNLNPKNHPAWGLTGVDNEDLTRHIMCCEMPDDDTPDNSQQAEDSVGEAYSYVMGTFVPRFFDRADGWDGKTVSHFIIPLLFAMNVSNLKLTHITVFLPHMCNFSTLMPYHSVPHKTPTFPAHMRHIVL